jgi:hypothetical protein
MYNMKKIILLALMAITLMPATAQEEDDQDFHASASLDLVSKYMWRGSELASISLQPALEVSWQGLSLEATASTGFDKDDLQDIDLTLMYSRWGFNIGVIDYWTRDADSENRYFRYTSDGPHQLEANLGYTCKYFSLQAYTMFGCNDFKINGDRAYSTYIELSVPFRAGGLDWTVSAGITPMESAGYTSTRTVQGLLKEITVVDKNYLYGEGFTCNMASVRATKTFCFKNFKLPVFAEFHANPYLQKANFLAGISIATF